MLPLPKAWKIGRKRANGVVEHAFDIRRRDDGGVAITNVQEKITDAEKQALFTHFGTPAKSITGKLVDGISITYATTEQPGTLEHFLTAVYDVPSPFSWMGAAK